MNDNPEVSVVTIFYNRVEGVRESIQSLLDQTHPSIEIIAMDDGSTDGTLEALKSFDDPRLRVVAQENSGFTVTMNRAIRASRGQFVAVHGAGDVSHPRRLELQAEVLRSRPEVGVVGCHVENDDLFGRPPKIMASPNGLPFFETLLDRNLFTHGEVMFRRSLYDLVGGYRESLTFAQDRDLWLRISRHADYAIVTEPLYRRLRFGGGVSRDVRKLFRQAYLSDFAVENARLGMATGQDLFDRYGEKALDKKPPSARLATRIVWMGGRFMASGRTEDGWLLVQMAAREKLTPHVARIYAVCATHKIKPLWNRVMLPYMRRRLLQTTDAE